MVPHWRSTDCFWTIEDQAGYRSSFGMSIFITKEKLLRHQLPPKSTQVANMDLVMKPLLLRTARLEYEYPWHFCIWYEHCVNTVLILHFGPDEASMPSKVHQYPSSFVIGSTLVWINWWVARLIRTLVWLVPLSPTPLRLLELFTIDTMLQGAKYQ